MRRAFRRIFGAFFGVAAFAAAAGVPGFLDDVSPPLPPPNPESIARTEQLTRIDELLAARMPEQSEEERMRISNALLAEAERFKLDPLFVLALIDVESAFEVDAVSFRGARGLMQLRPSTLRYEAARARLGDVDPADPVDNIRAGVSYYKRLERSFKRRDLALMAYNAGPGRIRTFLRDTGEIPERYLNYPQRVQGEYQRLRRNYGLEPVEVVIARAAARPEYSTE